MMANVPSSDIGTTALGMSVARKLRRKMRITKHHERDGEHQRELDVEHRGADRHRAVADHIHLHARRNDASKLRQGIIDALDGLDDVRAGLLEHDQENARLAVGRRAEQIIFGAANGMAHVFDADRRALLISQDDVVVIRRLHDLVVGGDREALHRAVDRALGRVGGNVAQNARTSSKVRSRVASFSGSTCTRTEGFCCPPTYTKDTPWICEICCERIFSA